MSQDINSIIDQLAEIDSASAKIMKQTQDEKNKYAEYISHQKQDFDADLEKQVDAAVADYEKQIEIESKKEIENCRADCDKAISQLEDYYKKNGESLAKDIFNNIIKEQSYAERKTYRLQWYDYQNQGNEKKADFS